MRLIYVCSPLRGDIEGNRARAAGYCRQVFEAGHYPIAPHLHLDWLDDSNDHDRVQGMQRGLAALRRCDEIWAFGGRITDGMEAEIDAAACLGLPVRYID